MIYLIFYYLNTQKISVINDLNNSDNLEFNIINFIFEIFIKYHDLINIFSEIKVNELSLHYDSLNYSISFEKNVKSSYNFIYNLFELKL